MFLREISSGYMIEVVDINHLTDLFHEEIQGRYQHGEEAQDPENFKKGDLTFLSGERLPRCWTDSHYREH